MHLRLLIICLSLVLLITGCARKDKEESSASNTTSQTQRNINQKESAGRGIPLFSFGRSGQNKIRAGDEDELFQEYLLWKEWVQYQKYNEWRREQALEQTDSEESQGQTSQ